MKYVVTGGRGFIGSHFVEAVLDRGDTVIDVDKMTYAASKPSLGTITLITNWWKKILANLNISHRVTFW